jgi:urease accessory protein
LPRSRETAAARLALAAVFVIAAAPPAFAHEVAGQAQGFLTGLRHPISGLDHVLAMVAVGLWGAQLGPPAVWLLPVTFPIVMALGGFLALLGVPLVASRLDRPLGIAAR